MNTCMVHQWPTDGESGIGIGLHVGEIRIQNGESVLKVGPTHQCCFSKNPESAVKTSIRKGWATELVQNR